MVWFKVYGIGWPLRELISILDSVTCHLYKVCKSLGLPFANYPPATGHTIHPCSASCWSRWGLALSVNTSFYSLHAVSPTVCLSVLQPSSGTAASSLWLSPPARSLKGPFLGYIPQQSYAVFPFTASVPVPQWLLGEPGPAFSSGFQPMDPQFSCLSFLSLPSLLFSWASFYHWFPFSFFICQFLKPSSSS